MHELLLGIWEQFLTTLIFVTHDVDEAVLLADRIIVMQAQPGRVHEVIRVPSTGSATEIIASVEFMRLKQHCLHLLRRDARGHALVRSLPLGFLNQA